MMGHDCIAFTESLRHKPSLRASLPSLCGIFDQFHLGFRCCAGQSVRGSREFLDWFENVLHIIFIPLAKS